MRLQGQNKKQGKGGEKQDGLQTKSSLGRPEVVDMGLGKSVTSAPCCADFCTLKGSGAAFLKHENKEMSGWCLLLWMQSRSATFLLSSGCIPSDERTNHTGDDEKYFRPNFARTSPVLVQVACTCTGTCAESRGTFAHGVGPTYLALAFVSPVG